VSGTERRGLAVVTGAGSPTGIGFAIARALGAAGHPLLVASTTARIHERVAELRAAGCEATGVACDLTDEAGIAALLAAVADARVDVLVNNAGMAVLGDMDALADLDCISLAQWRRSLERNLGTAFLATRALLPAMKSHGYGRIVNISSLMAMQGHMLGQRPGDIAGADYSAAKAGMVGLTKSLSFEVAPRGITVNAIAPGPVMTEIQGPKPKEQLERIPRDTAVGRFGRPEEIAQAVLYLVGPESGFITGQLLPVTGGVWGL